MNANLGQVFESSHKSLKTFVNKVLENPQNLAAKFQALYLPLSVVVELSPSKLLAQL